MAIKTKEELLNSIKTILADNSSDEVLSLYEDISDTIDASAGATDKIADLQKKYDDNDKMWREKYRNRFFSATDPEEDPDPDPDPKNDLESEKKTYEDLFTVKQ